MTIFIVLLVFVVAIAAFANKRWQIGRSIPRNDRSKGEVMKGDGIEIIVQNPNSERRLKLALPDFSSIPIRSPVSSMKSSVRCALEELRSRQMVRSLCSRFESREMIPMEIQTSDKEVINKPTAMSVQSMNVRRRDTQNASVAPVPQENKVAKEAQITTSARSNNLKKFLRSYASNLDRAISTERRLSNASGTFFGNQSVSLRTDSESDIEQPLLAPTMAIGDEAIPLPSKVSTRCADFGFQLELDLRARSSQLGSRYSNQCDTSPTADSDEENPCLPDALDCKALIKNDLPTINKGNNNAISKRGAARYSKAFTLDFSILEKQAALKYTNNNDVKSDDHADSLTKKALARFKQHVPSNGRRARNLAPLRI